MDRKLFIKNVLGALIGVAIVPKAITEYVVSTDFIKEVTTRSYVLANTSSYRIYDLLRVAEGMFCVIRPVEWEGGKKGYYARNIEGNGKPLDLIIIHSDNPSENGAIRMMSSAPELITSNL